MFFRRDKMTTIFFSSNMDTIDEWKMRHKIESSVSSYDIEDLYDEIKKLDSYVVVADYDTKANDINKLISSDTLLENVIVLERAPEIATGKILIYRGIKAYGNSRMLTNHYNQMIQTVLDNNIWTYPELTAALAKGAKSVSLNSDSIELLENKLTEKESEAVYLILDGLTNDAIANKMDITTRTVKAHVSSIFSKLHVSDRLSLVLLLK